MTNDCPRCSGSGFLARFSHVANGRCFRCGRSVGMPAMEPPTAESRRASAESIVRCYVSAAVNRLELGCLDAWEAVQSDEYQGPGTAEMLGSALRSCSPAARDVALRTLKALPLSANWWDRARGAWKVAA